MRFPQRFKRVPDQEPPEEQDISLLPYPAQTKVDDKSDDNVDFVYTSHPLHTATGYSAGAYNSAGYSVSHPTTLVERLEKHEHRRFGTRFFGAFYDNFIGGWRAGLLRAFLLSLAALVVNISVYAWLYRTFSTHEGTATLKHGSCRTVRGANTGIHAALNVLSTLILGVSTYAMQGMTAPSRKEVDAAHAKGKWVEIGTQSLRNLFYIRKRNAWVWALLAITSLPFHLFFNAVFFTTTQANQYAVAVVEESILTNTTFQPTVDNTSPSLFDEFVYPKEECDGADCSWDIRNSSSVLELVQDITNSFNVTDLVRMEPLECMTTYASGFMRGWGDVVLISTHTGADSPLLWTRYPQRSITLDKADSNQDPYHWICHDIISPNSTDGHALCSLKKARESLDSGKNWTVYGNVVEYCLARAIPDFCELQVNMWLMLPVVVFGGIKTFVIAYLLLVRPAGRFLRTLGDAIASFLEDEDATTRDMCLVSSKQVRKHGFQTSYEPQIYTNTRPRWLQSANTTEFFSTIGISAFYIVVLGTALGFAINGARGFAFSNGLGVPDIQSLATFQPDDTGSSGIVPTLLIANIPQLGFSLLYVVYTNIWSKLLVAREFDRMTREKKGVRVSERPRGKQRASHFFTLPTRYAMPLMACSAALHWLCSQSFFMVRIDGINSNGEIDPNDRLVRLGYSATGVLALIGLSVVLLVATVCVATFRRMGTSLGETSMSVVISAACHPGRWDTEPWLQEVQWGDMSESVEGSQGGVGEVVRHISFTARLAERPIVGQAYR